MDTVYFQMENNLMNKIKKFIRKLYTKIAMHFLHGKRYCNF